LVIVVRDRGPIAVIALLLTIVSLLVIVALFLLILNGRGNIMVIAIPGFPLESIATGLTLGTCVIVILRVIRRKQAT
jgi:hypothetical protein